MSGPRNVLFIIIDQLRADCLFGDLAAHAHIPNLRALMADAVSFTSHFSVTAPCGPSRVSILTGQYASNHRATRNGTPMRHDTPNLAGEARKAGLSPLLFGYCDTAQDPRVLAADDPRLRTYEEVMPGFNEVLRIRQEAETDDWRDHLRARGYGRLSNDALYRPAGDRPDAPAIYTAEDSDTAFLTDRVIDDLGDRKPGWLAHVTYIRPHPPFVAPAPYNQLIDPAGLPLPRQTDTEAAAHPFLGPARATAPLAAMVTGFPNLQATPENALMLRALYLGLLAEVDHHLGRLFASLKASGQYAKTLIVVMSDHGEMLGDFGLWGKRSYFDAAFHTPLIIRHPDLPERAGAKVTDPVESIDVTPTILDFLGLSQPDSMDGRSLLPLLGGGRPAGWRTGTYSELDFGDPLTPTLWQSALGLHTDEANLAILRTTCHRLVHFAAPLPQILFDMTAAGEAREISATPANQQIMLDLTREMLCHRMVHPDGTFARTLVTGDGVKVGSC